MTPGARPVEAVEGTAREIEIELRPVVGERLAQAIEYLDRQAARISRRLHHDRRHGGDKHELRHAPLTLTMLSDVVGRFATAGGVPDMDRISQVQMLYHGGSVGRVVIHVMTVAHLRRAAMAAPVMSDDAVALFEKIHQLRIPIVAF
jgi:hypothetical protein